MIRAIGAAALAARTPGLNRLPSSVDPAAVPAALTLGAEQAGEDAPALADFWRRS